MSAAAPQESHDPHESRRKALLGSVIRLACQIGLFLLVAAWVLWPLPLQFDARLPASPGDAGTQPMASTYALCWNASQVLNGFRYFWHAPMFSDHGHAFGLNEPHPMLAIAAPVAKLCNFVAGYNFYLLCSLAFNGLFTMRFLRIQGVGPSLSLMGGLAMMMHPLGMTHISVATLVPLWSMIWSLERLTVAFQQTRSKWGSMLNGLLLGVALVFTCFISVEQFLLFLLIATPSCVVLYSAEKSPAWTSILLQLTLAAFVTAGGTARYVGQLSKIRQDHAAEYSIDAIEQSSAKLTDWIRQPPASLTRIHTQNRHTEFNNRSALSPGLVRSVLFLMILVPACRGGWARANTVRYLSLIALLSCLFSFGSHLEVLGWFPLSSLRSLQPLPLLGHPYQAAILTQIAVLLAIGVTLGQFQHWFAAQECKPLLRRLKLSLLTAVVLAFTFETPPPQVELIRPPLDEDYEPWVHFVRRELSPNRGLLCLPVSESDTIEAFETEARWMLYGTQHVHPILNGFAQHYPQRWIDVRQRIRDGIFDQELVEQLRRLKCGALVIHKPSFTGNLAELKSKLELGYEDPQMVIWILRPSEAESREVLQE